MKYTLQDYSDITFAGFQCELTEVTRSIIKKLTTEFGITSPIEARSSDVDSNDGKYRKQGFFQPAHTKKHRNGTRNGNSEEQWEREKVEVLKTTVIEKKEGIEKLINDIRICLNKLSDKSYDKQKTAIIEFIHSIRNQDEKEQEQEQELESDDTDFQTISNAIFDIASKNKFYSKLYANLYKELLEVFPAFNNTLSPMVENYKNSIQTIVFVDQNVDYDKFCDNNKVNDNRKAMCAFIVNLMKLNVVDTTSVSDIILFLQNVVLQSIDMENKSYLVDEVTENLFLYTTMAIPELKAHESWETILSNIVELSKYKTKEHLSISSRAIFKYMDILDQIKK
jgi:hypothetical protein